MTRNRKKLCSVEGCRAYATASGLCSGHDPEVQKRAQEAKRDRTKGLGLPPLREPADAEAWIAEIGQLLATGKIKEGLARELRMVGKDWAAVHQGRLASQEFEALKRKVAELAGDREPWQRG